MTTGDGYLAKALELLVRADGETDLQIRAEFENLAAAFRRLAEQAERNTKLLPPEPEIDPKLEK